MSWEDFILPSVDDIISGMQIIPDILYSHPWYTAAAGAVVFPLYFLYLYCRFSLGMCRCRTDLTGKTVVITGANTGIGKATAMELAKCNAKVIMGCRNAERATQAVDDIKAATGNKNVIFKQLNLCSFASVRRFAESIKETENKLHILINNAGVTNSGGKLTETEDGCEYIMQTNHLGHFLLTLLLTDLLIKSSPSRIINVSSMAYRWAVMDLEDLNTKKKFDAFAIYYRTKLANVLFTREMSKRLQGTGVTVNALHPGVVKTDIFKNSPLMNGLFTRVIFFLFGKTPFEGAQTTLHLALSPDLEHVSGKYFSDCKEQKLTKIALDDELAKKLWKISEESVGHSLDN